MKKVKYIKVSEKTYEQLSQKKNQHSIETGEFKSFNNIISDLLKNNAATCEK